MNPSEVVLEFSADFAKGTEKVDYALHPRGEPTVLIEAKSASRTLSKDAPGQLQRYFISVEAAEYAVYTNGLHWHWYRAIPGKQRLEQQPLLSLDVTNPRSSELDFLYHISKDNFDLSRLYDISEELVATRMCLQWIKSAKSNPIEKFIVSMSTEIWGNNPQPSPTVIRKALINVLSQKRIAENKVPLPRKGTRKVSRQKHIASNWGQLWDMIAANEKMQKFTRTQEVFLDAEGNDLPLSSTKWRRAWRKKGEKWRTVTTGRDLQIEIINHLASLDKRGESGYFKHIAEYYNDQLIYKGARKSKYKDIRPNLCCFVLISNPGRKIMLSELANHVKTTGNRPIRVDDDPEADIQVWLPFVTKNKNKGAD